MGGVKEHEGGNRRDCRLTAVYPTLRSHLRSELKVAAHPQNHIMMMDDLRVTLQMATTPGQPIDRIPQESTYMHNLNNSDYLVVNERVRWMAPQIVEMKESRGVEVM